MRRIRYFSRINLEEVEVHRIKRIIHRFLSFRRIMGMIMRIIERIRKKKESIIKVNFSLFYLLLYDVKVVT